MSKLLTLKTFILLFSILVCTHISIAQLNLRNVMVEKYYISNAADSAASIGLLPVGSVTYRVYVQMTPGYKFEMAWGNAHNPLIISTSTTFFNNEDRGAIIPDGISVINDKKNTVMLDSWVSVGAAATGKAGVPKKYDTDGSIVIPAGILQNADTSCGVAVKTEDGMISGTPGSVTIIGGMNNELSILDATSQQGGLIVDTSGAWCCLPGTIGPDTANRVLIGQFTTTGIFSFKFMVQIGTPSGGIEIYVPDNLDSSQKHAFLYPDLSYTSSSIHAGIHNVPETFTAMNVFPNPANQILMLELATSDVGSTNNSYTLLDLSGRSIIHKDLGYISGVRMESIDLSNFPVGMYLLTAEINGFCATKKVVKN